LDFQRSGIFEFDDARGVGDDFTLGAGTLAGRLRKKSSVEISANLWRECFSESIRITFEGSVVLPDESNVAQDKHIAFDSFIVEHLEKALY
jgi:hypothetical protein